MKLLQNKKIAYLTAIFCTLLWGTAFPFIKVGYSAFEIEESDIGSKLIFAGMRFMLAGFMVFFFLWISKRKPPTLSKKIYCPSVHSEWCRQDCSIFLHTSESVLPAERTPL